MAKPVLSDLDFGNVSRVQNLPSPVSGGDAANKSYVDSAVEGLAWKDSCVVATQANVNLAGPGASVDGIAMVAGDRVLVRAQTTAAQNGFYVWNGAAVAMTRSLDANTWEELEQAITTVNEGTSAGVTYRQTAVGGILETDAISFSTFGQATPSATETQSGAIEIATQAEVDAGVDDQRAITPAKLAAHSNRKLKYSASFGDGAATQYTITHNLGTRDVIVSIAQASGTYDLVDCEVELTTVNSITCKFGSAPALNSLRATIIG